MCIYFIYILNFPPNYFGQQQLEDQQFKAKCDVIRKKKRVHNGSKSMANSGKFVNKQISKTSTYKKAVQSELGFNSAHIFKSIVNSVSIVTIDASRACCNFEQLSKCLFQLNLEFPNCWIIQVSDQIEWTVFAKHTLTAVPIIMMCYLCSERNLMNCLRGSKCRLFYWPEIREHSFCPSMYFYIFLLLILLPRSTINYNEC